jgi:predicted transcriptional regulator
MCTRISKLSPFRHTREFLPHHNLTPIPTDVLSRLRRRQAEAVTDHGRPTERAIEDGPREVVNDQVKLTETGYQKIH